MRRLAVGLIALASCGGGSPMVVANRERAAAPPREVTPMLGERGLRGHEDGSPPTKKSLEAMLPGAVVHESADSFVVELAGVPRSELVYKSVPAGVALLVLENGQEIDVFAREVTMSHGLAVRMTLAEAKARQPSLVCTTITTTTTCTLPSSPSFYFRIAEGPPARIDHVVYLRSRAK